MSRGCAEGEWSVRMKW